MIREDSRCGCLDKKDIRASIPFRCHCIPYVIRSLYRRINAEIENVVSKRFDEQWNHNLTCTHAPTELSKLQYLIEIHSELTNFHYYTPGSPTLLPTASLVVPLLIMFFFYFYFEVHHDMQHSKKKKINPACSNPRRRNMRKKPME